MCHGRFLTSHSEVVAAKAVGLEVQGERSVGLIQKQINTGHFNPLPLKDSAQNLPVEHRTELAYLRRTSSFQGHLLTSKLTKTK